MNTGTVKRPSLLFMEGILVLFEKLVVGAYGGQLRPAADLRGMSIQIVDFGAAQAEQKGRMRGDDKLTAEEAC